VLIAIGTDLSMHGCHAAREVAAVFDVVVDQKCVVQHLETRGRRHRVLRAAAEGRAVAMQSAGQTFRTARRTP
jgi:hypothetical protein